MGREGKTARDPSLDRCLVVHPNPVLIKKTSSASDLPTCTYVFNHKTPTHSIHFYFKKSAEKVESCTLSTQLFYLKTLKENTSLRAEEFQNEIGARRWGLRWEHDRYLT